MLAGFVTVLPEGSTPMALDFAALIGPILGGLGLIVASIAAWAGYRASRAAERANETAERAHKTAERANETAERAEEFARAQPLRGEYFAARIEANRELALVVHNLTMAVLARGLGSDDNINPRTGEQWHDAGSRWARFADEWDAFLQARTLLTPLLSQKIHEQLETYYHEFTETQGNFPRDRSGREVAVRRIFGEMLLAIRDDIGADPLGLDIDQLLPKVAPSRDVAGFIGVYLDED